MREGDKVAPGQPLVTFWKMGDLSAQRLMAAGMLEEAQAALDKTLKGARRKIEAAKARAATASSALRRIEGELRAAKIAGANARLVQAQVAADKAQIDADRAHKLVASGSISQAEGDNADAILKGAIAQRDALQQALDQLKNGVRSEEGFASAHAFDRSASQYELVEAGSRIEDIKAAQGAVDGAEARFDRRDDHGAHHPFAECRSRRVAQSSSWRHSRATRSRHH